MAFGNNKDQRPEPPDRMAENRSIRIHQCFKNNLQKQTSKQKIPHTTVSGFQELSASPLEEDTRKTEGQ